MKIVLPIICILFFVNYSFAQVESKNYGNDFCSVKKVTISVKVKKKSQHILFWKTNYLKVSRIDKVIGQNGNVVKETVMKSKESGDEYVYKKFRRLVIIGNEIHDCSANLISRKGIVKIYDFCGNLLDRKSISSEEVFEKYDFNVIVVPINGQTNVIL